MADSVTGAAAALLGVLFGWAALVKIVRPGRWMEALSGYRLRTPLAGVLSVAVPFAESSVAVLMFTGRTKVGGATAVALLASFSAAILRARAAGDERLPCGCFGGSRDVDFRLMLVRNAVLGSLAAIVLIGPEVGVTSEWEPPAGGELVPFVLAVMGAGLVVWVARAAAVARGQGRRQ